MKHSEQAIKDVAMIARNAIDRIIELESQKPELNCVCGAVWEGDEMVHAPRKREWVWLSPEDEQEIKNNCTTVACVLKAVKAKLKERNG